MQDASFWAFALAPASAVLALAWAGGLTRQLLRADGGNARMQAIAQAISQGAAAFLAGEYRALALFITVLAVVLYSAGSLGQGMPSGTAFTFVLGALSSIAAGYIGMRVAVKANVRTAEAARRGLAPALAIAFSGGAVMGLTVCGLGLLGASLVFLSVADPADPRTFEMLNGFGLGASSIALFARVGGGIFTKGADIGADLVGKLEAHIPEDDPRNPAVIADNVGDCVGDVAGMGADLFESYVGSLVAAIAIAAYDRSLGVSELLLPFVLAGVGILASLLGIGHVRRRPGEPAAALRAGTIVAALAFLAGLVAAGTVLAVPANYLWATASGLAVGVFLGLLSEYYTGATSRPVRHVAEAAVTGPATTVIGGLSLGMLSAGLPVACVAAAGLLAYHLAGLYGIALAAVGMLANTGINLSVDAYGPIADNAGGIAEMADLPDEVRDVTDQLDAVGNTTAAIGKGLAIGSAALTALALFAAFASAVHLQVLDLLDPRVMTGLLLGAVMPYIFSALAMNAVGRAAAETAHEVRRQFRDIPGLLEGEAEPDSARCVAIVTRTALREMLLPGTLAVVAPLIVGWALGPAAVGGLLAGAVSSGLVLAITMANAGGAFDNAKKLIEAGQLGGKGSAAHEAAVVGDTVGDPLKDTAGPALNILIKLMSIVALVFAPLFY